MKYRPFLLALAVAVAIHAIAGIALSMFSSTHERKPADAPRVAVTLELAATDLGSAKTDVRSSEARNGALIPANGRIPKEAGKRRAAVRDWSSGEVLTPSAGQAEEGTSAKVVAIPDQTTAENSLPGAGQVTEESYEGPAGSSEKNSREATGVPEASQGDAGKQSLSRPLLARDEPPYLIDTPPKFIEKGPISFPKDMANLTERTSITVYLSLSSTAEILSIEAIAKGVDELKVEVIKMILKSKFSPGLCTRNAGAVRRKMRRQHCHQTGRLITKTPLTTVLLLLAAASVNALAGKIVLFPEMFKGWQFEKSFVFAKEQGRYYPVASDGSFSIPSEGGGGLTLTAYVPGFDKETATFSPDATDVKMVVQIQKVSMEEVTYDAEVPRWLVNLETSVKNDVKPKEDLLSLLPFQATTGRDGKPQLFLDLGRLILLVERLTRK